LIHVVPDLPCLVPQPDRTLEQRSLPIRHGHHAFEAAGMESGDGDLDRIS
jgi:hypothetical protein